MTKSLATLPDSQFELDTIYKKLDQVTEASEGLLNTVYQSDRRVTLEQLTHAVFKSLNAESCCVFYVDRRGSKPHEPGKLVLEAEYPPRTDALPRPRPLKIQSKRGGGLTGHLAKKGEVKSLRWSELHRNPYRTRGKPKHHKSGCCYSWLFIPLKDRSGRLIAVVSVYNKLAADGHPNRDTWFDKVDICIARILAARIKPVLLGMRAFAAMHGLMGALRVAGDLDDFLFEILKVALNLVSAERGDFAWLDSNRLVTRAQIGKGKEEIGRPLPEKSIVHRVWQTGQRVVARDVREERDYHNVNRTTRSEVAVPVTVRSKVVGVLNAEARKPFDERDVELLTMLAGYAEIGAELLQRQDVLQVLDRNVSKQSRRKILRGIVKSVEDIYGFESIIYVADYRARKLKCVEATLPRGLKFEYKFDALAFATKVLRKRTALYSADPRHDPDVNLQGAKYFGVKTPMIGLPLIDRNHCWGVMVVYGTRKPGPRTAHQKQLEPFARLAAAAIALKDEESHTLGMIHAMQTGSPDETLDNILVAVRKAGFERVRVYRYDPAKDALIAKHSLGMRRPAEFLKQIIPMRSSPHSRLLKKHAQGSVVPLLLDPAEAGRDPFAKLLDKPVDLPWAMVPLVIAGNLYGSITADNAQSRRAITPDMLKRLGLLAAFAGQAIAAAESIEARDRQERERFVGDFMHVLKHPIGNVAALSEKLAANKLTAAERLQWNRYLHSEAQKLARIALQTHHWISAAVSVDSPADVSLTHLLRDSVRAFSATGEAAGVRLLSRLPRGSCMVSGDADRISVALNQLIENAISFAPRTSRVVLKLEIERSQYRVSVIDSGPGVPANMRDQVFEPFYTLRPADHAGTGLGLSIARCVVQAHHGKIGVRPGPGGRGSCFWFTLPRPPVQPSPRRTPR
jgi:signal transduction histidine kinase